MYLAKTSNIKFPSNAKYACIDGKNYAVPELGNYVIECERGFLYLTTENPNAVFLESDDSWKPTRKLLQAVHPELLTPCPLRIRKIHKADCGVRIFSCSVKPFDKSLDLVDCTRFS